LGQCRCFTDALCSVTVLSSSVLQSFHPLLQQRQCQQAFLEELPRTHAKQQQVIGLGGTAEQDIDGEEGIAIAHAFELHANEMLSVVELYVPHRACEFSNEETPFLPDTHLYVHAAHDKL